MTVSILMKSMLRLLSLVAMLVLTPFARADGAASCKAPSWSPAPMPGFVIDSCESKAWASTDYDLPVGSKTLQGSRAEVEYTLKDQSKNPTAAQARDFQIAAAKAAGASLMSDPGNSFQAVLMQKTAGAEFWYVYDHGSGSDSETGSYTLTTFKIAPVPQDVVAQAMKAPLAAPGGACSDPPWLVKQFAWFKRDSCEHMAWDQLKLDLPAGEKTVAGNRLTVNYTLTDDKQDPAALAVQKNYIAALQKIGAKLVSDPSAQYTAVLTQQTTAGEFWYVYQHGSGSSDSTGSYSLTTLQIEPFPQVVVAQLPTGSLADMQGKGCKAPPWLVKQFDYFKLGDCTTRAFDSITLDLPGGQKTLAGHVLDVNYVLTNDKLDPMAAFVKKNYVNALEKIGAKLVSDPDDVFQAVLTQSTPQGELWYIYKHGSGSETSTGSYSLTSLQIGGPPPKACTMEVYGVNFDFNQSTIKPESEPVLQQVLALFTADPSYSAEVGGHTDNVGKRAYNMTLSAARAEAVKAWLVAHGVAATRMTTHGYADTVPLVPNTTDENRAKNRRVELKRNDCKG